MLVTLNYMLTSNGNCEVRLMIRRQQLGRRRVADNRFTDFTSLIGRDGDVYVDVVFVKTPTAS